MHTLNRQPKRSKFVRSLTSSLAAFSMVATALVATSLSAASPAQAVQRITKQTGFNGRAWSVTSADSQGIRYVGGDFTSYQAWNTGQAAVVDATTGEVDPSYPEVNGWPYERAAAPDGHGGWYIGGAMSNVGGTTVSRIAHINSDGSVDTSWTPSVTGGQGVLTIAVYGDVVLLGGSFNAVNGTARNRIAAIKTDGTLLSWNPNANSGVMSLELLADTVYVGGNFSNIAGATRNLAASIRLDARTGGATGTCLTNWDATDCLTSWNPNVSGWGVKSIAISGADTYLAGAFSTVGGQNRTGVAKVNTTTGAVGSFNAQLDSEAGAVVVGGGVAYVGGAFTSAGGATRNHLAAFDTTTDAMTSWNPNVTGNEINGMTMQGSTVYFVGVFSFVGGVGRNHAAAVDAAGTLLPWDPHVADQGNGAQSRVSGIASTATQVYILGDFSAVGGLHRMHAAAVDSAGLITNWAPAVNGPVFSFSRSGSTIYMGGNFSIINGQSRQGAGAVDTSGAVTAWDPHLDGRAVSIIALPTRVYVAGWFNNVASTAMNNIAAVDPSTGAIDLAFDADVDNAVRTMTLSGGTLFIGGDFSTVGGQAHGNVASVDAATGAVNSAFTASTGVGTQIWSFLEAIAVVGNRVYIGGYFGQVNGQTRNFIAAVDKTTGALDANFNPSVSSWVFAITPSVDQSKLYIGGDAITVTGTNGSAAGIAEINPVTGALSSWRADTGEVRGISVSSSVVYLAGSFDNVGGQSRQNTAAVGTIGDILDPWPMNPSTNVTLDVIIPNQEPGAVTSSPSGIDCGGGTCAYAFSTGSTVTLTAVPDAGQAFTGWAGSCTGTTATCTVTLATATTATAHFGVASVPGNSNSNSSTPSATPTPTVTPSPTPTPTPTETPAPVTPTVVAVSKAITFAPGNAMLDAADKRALDAVAAQIAVLANAKVTLQGFAQKTSKSRQDLAVATARAKAALAYLKTKGLTARFTLIPARKATDPRDVARRVVVKVIGTK